MEIAIIAALAAALLVMGITSVRRRLSKADENVSSAMNQIGVQLSSRMDALEELIRVVGACDAYGAQRLHEDVQNRRRAVTAQSAPDEVQAQEHAISAALLGIAAIAAQHPELQAEAAYRKWMGAVNCYGKMLRTSRLIYNDSVDKFNQAVRSMPCRLFAGLLGYHRRARMEDTLYTEENGGKQHGIIQQ